MSSMSDYVSTGDSVSLTKIGDKPFTIIHVEDSDYTNQKGETNKGVKITTKESFDVKDDEGKELGAFSKFHTTRIAIVNFLSKKDVRADINDNNKPLGTVMCKEGKSKSRGTTLFTLVDCDADGKEIVKE